MRSRISSPTDDAVLVTVRVHRRPRLAAFIIVTVAAGMLKNKVKRRRFQRDATSGKVNEISSSSDKPEKKAHHKKPAWFSLLCGKGSSDHSMADPEDVIQSLQHKLENASTSTEYSHYKNERLKVLETERDQAWHEPARQRAAASEVEANRLVLRIREQERLQKGLFGEEPSEDVPTDDLRDLGGRFLVNRERIDRSRLFEIAKHMPKGAHLHLHFNSELPPEQLMPHARKLVDTMYIRSTRPLTTADNFNNAEIVFDVLPSSTLEYDVFSPDYFIGDKSKKDYSNSWMKWATFRQAFPRSVSLNNIKHEVGWQGQADARYPVPLAVESLDNAERWAREKMIVTRDRAYHDRQTTNGAWACFNQGTRAFKGLLNYESVYRWYVGQMIQSMIDDKIMYAELRPMLLDKAIPSDDGTKKLDHYAQMTIVCEEIQRKRGELEADGKGDLFPFGLKIIYSTPRSIPPAMMKKELEDCLRLKLKFPNLICGFDLVGAEDRKNHIGFYADLLVAFTNTCRENGVTIPFMFHAGETLLDTGGSDDPNNSNLYDALLLHSKRIGHGYSLLKHPTLVKDYKANSICLEVCPTSNEILHLCGNVRQHILPELLAAGLQCTLNADNPNLFSNSLSYEFYQVMVGDTRMNIHGWKQLAEWSIEHACLSEDEQKRAKTIFSNEWEQFCGWIVENYGDTLDTPSEPKDATKL